MKIAIFGAGNVGSALGKGWAAKGHAIYYGVPEPQGEKMRAVLKETGGNARAGSVREAADASEVIVLAVPYPAVREAVAAAGEFDNKVVIDCTNPLKPDLSGLVLGQDTSAGEQVREWTRGARVVKAFNTTGSGNMENTNYGGSGITMLLAGDDAGAKSTVAKLAEDLGFEPLDAGPLANARLLEPFAMLWIYLAVKQGLGPNIAFKLLRR